MLSIDQAARSRTCGSSRTECNERSAMSNTSANPSSTASRWIRLRGRIARARRDSWRWPRRGRRDAQCTHHRLRPQQLHGDYPDFLAVRGEVYMPKTPSKRTTASASSAASPSPTRGTRPPARSGSSTLGRRRNPLAVFYFDVLEASELEDASGRTRAVPRVRPAGERPRGGSGRYRGRGRLPRPATRGPR